MHEVLIRAATAEDAPSLSVVILAAFEEYRGRLSPPSGAHGQTVEAVREKMTSARAVVASIDQDIVGCAFYETEANHVYLGRVAVLPQYRRQRIGRKLVAWVEAQVRWLGYTHVRLAVRVALPDNRAFCERLGYRFHSYGTHAGFAEPTFVNLEKDVT